jgi:hypothetical protein
VKRDVAWGLLPPATKVPPGISAETDLLRMDLHHQA